MGLPCWRLGPTGSLLDPLPGEWGRLPRTKVPIFLPACVGCWGCPTSPRVGQAGTKKAPTAWRICPHGLGIPALAGEPGPLEGHPIIRRRERRKGLTSRQMGSHSGLGEADFERLQPPASSTPNRVTARSDVHHPGAVLQHKALQGRLLWLSVRV